MGFETSPFFLLFLLIIGIPTDFISDEISAEYSYKCEKIAELVTKNSKNINPALSVNAPANGKCIRYNIRTTKDIDKLFTQIDEQDKNELLALVGSSFFERIEISEATDCIMFQLKSSFHGLFLVGSYKTLFLIYEQNPECNCSSNPIGYPNYPDYVKKIKDHWFKVKVKTSQRYFGC